MSSHNESGPGAVHAEAAKNATPQESASSTIMPGSEANGRATGAEAWPTPRPLVDSPRPLFPTWVLPASMAQMVREVARAAQTPEDLVGMTTLGAVAALVGGRVRIRAWGDWVEPTNLFVATALPPGERKSAVHRQVMGPIHEVEKQLAQDTAADRRLAAEQRQTLDRRLKHLRQQSARAEDPEERHMLTEQAAACQAELDEIAPSVAPRLLADDVTPEALTRLLAEQGGFMTVSSAEGGFIDIVAGRYSKNGEANLDVLLKAHAGDPIRVDRIGRDGETVDEPALTLVLAFQPDVLKSMGGRVSFAGRGLLARFLFAVPAPMVGRREVAPEPASPSALEGWRQLALVLGSRITPRHEPVELSLADDAEAALRYFAEEVEPRLASTEGDLSDLAGWGGKLVGAVLRLSALVHLGETYGEVDRHPIVSLGAVEAAITIGRYLVDHARLAFGEMGATGDDADTAGRVVAWVRRKRLTTFTERQLQMAEVLPRQGGKRAPAEAYHPALELLVDRDWLHREEPSVGARGGRPPSPTYHLNPRLPS